jgi:prepilin-type N-terminal cleavage/methylation domain-containing protein
MNKGFTLIELLIVIGIISILSSGVILAINPSRQFKLARDSKRSTDVNTILNALSQNMSENKGVLTCDGNIEVIPQTESVIKSMGGFNIAPCVVPLFLTAIPHDPNKTEAYYTNENDYNSQYKISMSNGRIMIKAESEIDPQKPITAVR